MMYVLPFTTTIINLSVPKYYDAVRLLESSSPTGINASLRYLCIQEHASSSEVMIVPKNK